MSSSIRYRPIQSSDPSPSNNSSLPEEATTLIYQTALDLASPTAEIDKIAKTFAKGTVHIIKTTEDSSCLSSLVKETEEKRLYENRPFVHIVLRTIGPLDTKDSDHKKLSPERLAILSSVTSCLATP